MLCPAGFMQQLGLFQAMGCCLDESYLPYKRFLLERLGKAYEETGLLDAASLAQPTDAGDGDVRGEGEADSRESHMATCPA